MLRIALIAALFVVPGGAMAQDRQAETGQTPQRIRSVTVTGNEACPRSTDQEIIVCSRIGAGEEFRIPTALRETAPTAANESWVNRAASVDNVSRVAAGLPDTCSPIGTGGQSGCALRLNNAYAADKREREAEGRQVPGGEDDELADDE